MNDDVRRRLDEAAHRPVPPPDPAFADALEERLSAVAASLPPEPPSTVPRPHRRQVAAGPWITAGVALAIVAIVAIAGPWRLVPDLAPDLGHALAQPVNVAVVLVDGTVLEDPDGLLLPEGAIVTVGDGGSARVGDTVLGPGDVATVRDGRLEVEQASPRVAGPALTPTPRPSATPAPATPSPPPASSPTRTPAPTPRPTPAPTPRPTNPPATVQPTPTPTPAILRPRLRARLIDGPKIAVRWSETWSADRYALLATVSRSGPAPDPIYGRVGRVLGEFDAPPERAVRFRVPEGVVEVRLLVVALREDGTVLRRSRVVTVMTPPPGDTTGDASGSPASPSSPTPAATLPPAS